MLLNKELVNQARQIIDYKRAYWEEKLNVKFDADGRVAMGTLSSFDENDWRNVVYANQSREFAECFLEGLDALGLVRFNLRDLTFEDYKKKRVTVTTTKGRVQEKNIAALLQKAHDIWEKKYDLYRPYRNHIKQVRSEDGPTVMDELSPILAKMEIGNTYIAYDKLLREFQERQLMISINPIDKLFASGGSGYNFEDTPTNINSCWSNRFVKREPDCYEICPAGGYSSPEAQFTLGSHLCSGMLVLPNGNTIEIDGMKMHGMAQRSHIWLDEEGVYIENVYPDKYNAKRLKEISDIISKKAKVISVSGWRRVNYDESKFDKNAWYRKIKEEVDTTRVIYMDRSAIQHGDGDVWITPSFRYHSFGGSMWLPNDVNTRRN